MKIYKDIQLWKCKSPERISSPQISIDFVNNIAEMAKTGRLYAVN